MDKQQFYALWNTRANCDHNGHGHEIYGWWAQQDEREFQVLVEEVAKINPKRILEIGSSHGGTLFFWDRLVGSGGQTVGMNFDKQSMNLTLDFSASHSEVTFLHQSNSHLPETKAKVESIFDGPIDFLFIDGDHSYNGVKADYEDYSPLVRPGGLVGFHDICMEADDLSLHNMGASKFFRELDVPNKKRIEYSFGIGIVYL